jgi:hypothetical protein
MPIKSMTKDGLIEKFGRPIKQTVLADYLGIDARTLKAHIEHTDRALGGSLEITPGTWWFFENLFEEAINNGTYKKEAWETKSGWIDRYQRERKDRLPGRKVIPIGKQRRSPEFGGLGARPKRTDQGEEGNRRDPFGLLESSGLGK